MPFYSLPPSTVPSSTIVGVVKDRSPLNTQSPTSPTLESKILVAKPSVERSNPNISNNDEGKDPAKLPLKERIRHFTWTWFTMTMATGGIANVMYETSYLRLPAVNVIKTFCSRLNAVSRSIRYRMYILSLEHLSLSLQHRNYLCPFLPLPLYLPCFIPAPDRVTFHSRSSSFFWHDFDQHYAVWCRYGNRYLA